MAEPVKTGVPVWRFYTVMVICMTIGSLFGYIAGQKYGEQNEVVKSQKLQLKNQKKVYYYDQELFENMPDGADVDVWAEWMLNR